MNLLKRLVGTKYHAETKCHYKTKCHAEFISAPHMLNRRHAGRLSAGYRWLGYLPVGCPIRGAADGMTAWIWQLAGGANKPTGEGTGLGLSLSYDIVVKGHGETIGVETEEGVYTEFKIILPLS